MTWDSSDFSDDTYEPVPQAPVPWISPFVLSSVLRRGSIRIAILVHPEDSPFGFSNSGRSLALLEHSAFKLLDAFCQPRQAAELGDLFLYFLEWPGGSAPYDLLAAYDFSRGNSCLGPNHCAVFNSAMIGDPHLASDGHIFPHDGRTRNARLRGDYGVFPDDYVMRHVNQIVQFRAFPDLRAAKRSAIDCAVGPDFHIILNF